MFTKEIVLCVVFYTFYVEKLMHGKSKTLTIKSILYLLVLLQKF